MMGGPRLSAGLGGQWDPSAGTGGSEFSVILVTPKKWEGNCATFLALAFASLLWGLECVLPKL